MAGIGFVLERLLITGGAKNLFLVAVSGTALVAGPWLLSAASIFLAVSLVPPSVAAPFQQTLVYVFAASLVFFGGLHLTYTRTIADLHYFQLFSAQGRALGKAAALVTFFSVIIGVILARFSIPAAPTNGAWWERLWVLLMVVVVNISFLEMIHSTQIERFILVPLGYLTGGICIVALAAPLTAAFGLAGMYASFTLGFLVVDLSLLFVSLTPKKKERRRGRRKFDVIEESLESVPLEPEDLRKLSKADRRLLWLAGTALYLLLWIDKAYYWFFLGSPIAGTALYGYPAYDVAIFWGQITIIPGLIYYLVIGETSFFRELRRSVRAVMNRPFLGVQRQKQRLLETHRYHLARQTILQLVFVASLLPLTSHAAQLIYGDSSRAAVILTVLVGSAIYLTHYTLFINLLYLKRYLDAVIATSAGLLVTLLALLLPRHPEIWLGLPFALGSLAGAVVGGILFTRAANRIDRQLLTAA